MESITGFSIDNCERDIKFSKKMVTGQILWVTFNLAITFFDAHTLMINPTAWTGASFGAMLVTSLWSLMFLLESCRELKSEKLRFKFLTELHDTQIASMEREQYKMSKLHYDQLRESLEKNNDTRTI